MPRRRRIRDHRHAPALRGRTDQFECVQRDRDEAAWCAALREQRVLRALAEILRGERERALHADRAEAVGVLLLAMAQHDDLLRGSVRCDGSESRCSQSKR
jgi:hypothetical protein